MNKLQRLHYRTMETELYLDPLPEAPKVTRYIPITDQCEGKRGFWVGNAIMLYDSQEFSLKKFMHMVFMRLELFLQGDSVSGKKYR